MENQKKCIKCKVFKDFSDFYKRKDTIEGYRNDCKLCVNKRVNADYRENLQARKKTKIMYYENNKARCLKMCKKYYYSKKGKTNHKKRMSVWRKKNPLKINAGYKARYAVKVGKIKKPKKCELCKSYKKVQGHHEDYNFPLIVKWLCHKCHCLTHKIKRRQKEI